MNSLKNLADTLVSAREAQGKTDAGLARETGLQRLTVARAFSGKENYGVTTLLALASRLGLEVVLVPAGTARAIEGVGTVAPVQLPSAVDDARNL